MGFAGLADVAAVEDEPVVGDGEFVLGDVLDEFALGLEGGFAVVGKSDAVGDTEDVGVDGKGGFVEDYGGDDVGGFASYARELLQLVDVGGNVASELFDEGAGHGGEVLAFVVGIGNGVDVGKEVVGGGLCHGLGVGVGLEECGGGHVDAFVGALGRENDRYKELEGVFVVQLGLGGGHGFFEPCYSLLVSFFLCHVKRMRGLLVGGYAEVDNDGTVVGNGG